MTNTPASRAGDKGGDAHAGEFRQFTDYWCQRYAAEHPGLVFEFQPRDGVMLSEPWRRAGKDLRLAKAVVDAYFADRSFRYEGHPTNLLKLDVMKFLKRAGEQLARKGSNGHGQHRNDDPYQIPLLG